jgi:hypothetical protein
MKTNRPNLFPAASFALGLFLLAVPAWGQPAWESAVKIIETDAGRGSGFLVQDGESTYLMSNAHVLAGCKTFKAIGMQGGELELTPYIEVASDGRDLVRIPVRVTGGLEPAVSVSIGEPIIVLGNSGGARMVTHSKGKVLAVGPDRVEVDAAFIQGNSGGPVLNASNQVVGVATYVFRDAVPQWVAQNTRYAQTRRVAMRPTGVQWLLLNWYDFQREGELLAKHQQFFEEFVGRLNEAFRMRDLDTVMKEKQGMRTFLSRFNRDVQGLKVEYFKEDLKEVANGWEDVAKFLNENFPDTNRIRPGSSSFTRAPKAEPNWGKVNVDRAAAYLKEKAIRDKENAEALDDRIRQGLETGLVNGIPFQDAMKKVPDYGTRKKYEEIANRLSVEIEHNYQQALKLYGDSTPQGIGILKKMVVLHQSMGQLLKLQATKNRLRALGVPGY